MIHSNNRYYIAQLCSIHSIGLNTWLLYQKFVHIRDFVDWTFSDVEGRK
jgi:hypothetical protein